MNAKYVVIRYPSEIGDVPQEAIYIIPDWTNHSTFANRMAPVRDILSAGFITLRDGELFCHGHSHSLGLNARPDEDGTLANMLFGRNT